MSISDENAQEPDLSEYTGISSGYEKGMDGVDRNISESKTVILKAITHRGTQTIIQCNPNLPKEDFIDMIIKERV